MRACWISSDVIRIFYKIHSEYLKQGFPFISTSLVLSGVSMYWLGRPSVNDKIGTCGYIKRISEKLLTIIKADNIPTLPEQDQKKPVVLFDVENILIKPRLFPLNFCFSAYKRKFSDVFLFHLAHIYELVSITSLDDESLYKKIDPYGCISYRLFVPDKKLFEPKHLNRNLKKVVCIASKENEYNHKFHENTLNIGSWNEIGDKRLLQVLDFLINLYFTSINDWRKTISSYRGKDFYETFGKVHKNIFFRRNFLSFNLENKYKNTIENINKSRIMEFKRAEVIMEENIAKEEVESQHPSIYEKISDFIKNLLF
eukprot:jgi/Antlo1/276/683